MYVIMYIYNYAYMYKISTDILIGLHNIKYWDLVELSTHYDWEGEFPWIGFSNFEFHLFESTWEVVLPIDLVFMVQEDHISSFRKNRLKAREVDQTI